MLNKFTIKNFKPFGEEQVAELAPITLIYGPNSSGKSSFIQALMVLRQTLHEQRPNGSSDLITKGGSVDVGNFLSVLHGHDETREIEFGLSISPKVMQRSSMRFPVDMDSDIDVGITISSQRQQSGVYSPLLTSVNFGIPHRSGKVSYCFNRETTALFSQLCLDEDEFPVDCNRAERYVLTTDTDRKALSAFLSNYISDGSSKVGWRPFPRIDISPDQVSRALHRAVASRRTNGPNGNDYLPCNVEISSVASGADPEKAISYAFSEVNRFAYLALRRTLLGLGYLGPLRSHPARHYLLEGNTGFSVGSTGEFTVPILFEDQASSQGSSGVYPSPRGPLISAVNEWFAQFEIPYELNVDNIGSPITGDFIVLTLKDLRTGVLVGPADVGFGIGQLMPILVEGILDGPMPNSWKVLCVEQPEIHLHPRLQAHLADFFISTAKLNRTENPKGRSSEVRRRGNGSQWIIETHSEALILRLQRRIREKTIKSDDISVLYVEPCGDIGAKVTRLRMDENGEFIDEWPSGFFEESFREMMEGR